MKKLLYFIALCVFIGGTGLTVNYWFGPYYGVASEIVASMIAYYFLVKQRIHLNKSKVK